jgi:hypothetical protein
MSAFASRAERRRLPLTGEQLDRLREALDPEATAVRARPLAGGIDTATYALQLEREEATREVVVRVYRDWDGEGDARTAARRTHDVLRAVGAVSARARHRHEGGTAWAADLRPHPALAARAPHATDARQ